jgi:putative hemin transport protein
VSGGVSRGEILAGRVGEGVVRLEGPADILRAAPLLGTVIAVTSNEQVVLEKVGCYGNVSIGPERGTVANHEIDLRLVMRHWRHAFAVKGEYPSLQFFDGWGEPVHEIRTLVYSDLVEFGKITAEFASPQQRREWSVQDGPVPVQARPDGGVDREQLQGQWSALQDTHDFVRLLQKLSLDRHQALRLIGTQFANEVSNVAAKHLLLNAAAATMPILVFAGNAGCLQIHAGTVTNILLEGHALSVQDQSFRLRLCEDGIGSSWVVRKPTRDGVLTSLEVYDRTNQMVVQFYGAREAGMPERQDWCRILSELPQPV